MWVQQLLENNVWFSLEAVNSELQVSVESSLRPSLKLGYKPTVLTIHGNTTLVSYFHKRVGGILVGVRISPKIIQEHL